MPEWLAVILIVGAGYALVLLTRISSQLEELNDKLDALLAQKGGKGHGGG